MKCNLSHFVGLDTEFYPNVSDGGLPSSAICNGFERCPTYQAGKTNISPFPRESFYNHCFSFLQCLCLYLCVKGWACILLFATCSGKGLNGVATAVEFTFVPHGADFYDISIINGFNIGIEMLGYLDSGFS